MLGDTITLAYNMREGESLRYKTEVLSEQTMKEDGKSPQTGTSLLEMTMLQAVKQVTPDGQMKVAVTIESGSIKKDGQVAPLPSVGQTINIVMEKSGKIVQTDVPFPFSQPAFPTDPVGMNQSWTGKSEMDIPLYDDAGNETGKKQVTLNYEYTLGGFEHQLGYETAVINVKCPSTSIELQEGITQTIKANGVTNFGHKQGRLIRSKVSTETEITAPGATVGTKIKVNVELVDASSGPSEGGGGIGSDEQFIIR
ncbi:MAG: hypothetical protein AB7S38_14505 [Vulcanimicrobiota bacterium]